MLMHTKLILLCMEVSLNFKFRMLELLNWLSYFYSFPSFLFLKFLFSNTEDRSEGNDVPG